MLNRIFEILICHRTLFVLFVYVKALNYLKALPKTVIAIIERCTDSHALGEVLTEFIKV